MTDIRRLAITHPTPVFVGAAASIAAFATTTTPSLFPIVLLLTTLLLHARTIVPREAAIKKATFLWLSLTVATSLAHLWPSLHATSTPATSVFILACFSAVTSFIALSTIFLEAFVSARIGGGWSQLTLFPALWATVWWGVSNSVSPIGRLVTWTPVFGVEQYHWITQYTGPVGIDWVVAAWAVIGSQAIGNWLVGSEPEKHSREDRLIPHDAPDDDVYPNGSSSPSARRPSNMLLLGGLLTALAIPSYTSSNLPLPPASSDSTPLSVGCVLPSALYSKHSTPTLDDFIRESQTMTKAKVILWPEGAVRFQNEEERDAGLERVRTEVRGPIVGVSFEEYAPIDSRLPHGRGSLRRTGVALVSKDSPVPHMIYFKRHLVPVAESFSLTPSGEPPSIFTLDLPPPAKVPKSEWAPGPGHTRPIPLSASICLDFAWPSAFQDLDSRPALILAPARTWHTTIGIAMWEQAKARAEEIGSMVLWCDGGEGGVSGVGGRGMNEVTQVGDGSWIRTIGLQWPFNESRTVYARNGNVFLALFWVMVGGGWATGYAFAMVGGGHSQSGGALGWVAGGARNVRIAVEGWRERRRIAQSAEPELGEGQSLLG